MKTLALALILALHVTTLWSHLPEHVRDNLTTTANSGRLTTKAPTPIRLTSIGPLPVRISQTSLNLNAASAIAIDAATGTILFAKNPTDRRPIASVTKMVTTMVILSRHDPKKPATIPTLPPYQPYDERLGFQPGETYTIGGLVDAALINSANDAADALAILDTGTTSKFAASMNTKMAEWGIGDTHFSNPTGLIDENNYSTAQSLAKIAGLVLTSPYARTSMLKSESTITSSAGRVVNLTATNKLLATGQFYGIKTGYTPAAGECFVGLTRIQGHEIITVILGSGDRFGATQSLRNWIEQSWQWL